jgi:protein-tyrosine phosphatase
MAEGFLSDRSERLLDGALSVRSSGTWARPGYPAMPEAVEATAERGIDIGSHKAAQFSPDLAGWADLIVTMTAEHGEEVLDQVPGAASKTFTLKEVVGLLNALPSAAGPVSREALLERVAAAHRLRSGVEPPTSGDLDVADPLGLPVETYRATAWEIEELVDALVRGLAGADRSMAAPERED